MSGSCFLGADGVLGRATVWDVASGRNLHTLRHGDMVEDAKFSPDGTKVVTASDDKKARIWDVASGRLLHTLLGHTEEVSVAEFSPDGKLVLTDSWDGTTRIWDAASGNPLHMLQP